MAGIEQENHLDSVRLSRFREYVNAVGDSLGRPPTTRDVQLAAAEEIGQLQYRGEIPYEPYNIVFQEPNTILTHPQFEFHLAKGVIRKNDGTVIKLTLMESGFFYALMSQSGQVVSHDTFRNFANYLYLPIDQVGDIVKVHMSHIREKIGDHRLENSTEWRYINNVPRKGYYLNPQ